MKYKIVGILISMLVTTTMVSAININSGENIQKTTTRDVFPYIPGLNWGVDQKQTWTDRYGMILISPSTFAQSFTPTKEKLTAVSLAIFKHGIPLEPIQITVSIRDNLTGSNLATKTIDTSVVTIRKNGSWVLFDFEDISINPGSPYFIICSSNASNATNAYCWFYSNNSTYNGGEAWIKFDAYSEWSTLKEVGYGADFCFKTYYRKPLDSSVLKNNEIANHLFLFIFKRFLHIFPKLQFLIVS